jgi:hypothetical protein
MKHQLPSLLQSPVFVWQRAGKLPGLQSYLAGKAVYGLTEKLALDRMSSKVIRLHMNCQLKDAV